jgi:hypothetical protein
MKTKIKFLAFAALIILLTQPLPAPVFAQAVCAFYPVSPALTDLGPNEYMRLVDTDPLTYVPTGVIGGLYPGGSNLRPPAHEAAGVAAAGQVVSRDAAGNPALNGKIGMISVGMSNTQMDFGGFKVLADTDPQVNDHLVVVNGAAGGGVIEAWVDPTDPNYQLYWDNFYSKIAAAGLTVEQMQVVWVKITQLDYQPDFPADMQALSDMYVTLAQMLKQRLPNLKITYFSSRTRSFTYFLGLAPETTAFENGFAVRWMIEKQLNGDPALNYDPARGPVTSSYISWGPYLWIDGLNPRLDGKVWLLSYVTDRDCTHPTSAGIDYVADMMMEFFKSDTTSIPWFLNEPPTPSATPTRTTTPGPTPTRTATLAATPPALPNHLFLPGLRQSLGTQVAAPVLWLVVLILLAVLKRWR